MSSIGEALRAGLKEFESRPLHKGALVEPDGDGVCAVGSMYLGLGGKVRCIQVEDQKIPLITGGLSHQAYEAWQYLNSFNPRGYKTVQAFNDDPNTTKEDVVLLMKEALYDLEDE